jgi:UDP-glucuronate 4-epimerase
MNNKVLLITGSAGFIGSVTAKKLLMLGYQVIGIDNLNSYYDVSLKKERLEELEPHKNFKFFNIDIADSEKLTNLFQELRPNIVINLAAQAGVRYSLENPRAYLDSNLVGFFNILENVKNFNIERLIFASSSSVYGASSEIPYKVTTSTDSPVSLYAATKKSNESLAYAYSNICKIPVIGLRFFTVYGPMGRPDMAYFKFTNMIAKNKEMTIYNEGKMSRDMTYIDDIVDGVVSSISFDSFKEDSFYEVFNLGNDAPVSTWTLVEYIEKYIGQKAKYKFEFSEIEVKKTWADISKSRSGLNYNPKVSFEQGMDNFLSWYKDRYL